MNDVARSRPFWPGYLLGIVTAMCLVGLIGVVGQPPAALAQIPDSGAQRVQMIREQQTTNHKLAEIVTLLGEIRDLQASASDTQKSKKTKSTARQP